MKRKQPNVFEACLLLDWGVSSLLRHRLTTENCTNGGWGVRSPHSSTLFACHCIHLFSESFFLPQPTDISPALLVARGQATGFPPASQHSVSLPGLGMSLHGKANNHLLAWHEEWERRKGIGQEKVSVKCSGKQWKEKTESREAGGEEGWRSSLVCSRKTCFKCYLVGVIQR